MGPRSHERGNRDQAHRVGSVLLASMGPRSHERGNWLDDHRVTGDSILLQWGRVLMNAETVIAGRHPTRFTLVLQWGRVLMNAETGDYKADVSSLPTELQWGRVLMNAETRCPEVQHTEAFMLQWGRVLMNAETRSDQEAGSGTQVASMGPRSHERGNERVDRVTGQDLGALLQWGRVLMNAETTCLT